MQKNTIQTKGTHSLKTALHQAKRSLPLQNGCFKTQMLNISTLALRHHARVEYILSATERLSKSLGIQPSQNTYRSHTGMTAYLYPDAGQYRIVLANLFYDLLHCIDDLFREKPNNAAPLQQLTQIWKTGTINQEALNALTNERFHSVCTAMTWLRKRFRESCEPALFKKISRLLVEHLTEQFLPRHYTDTESYVQLRRRFSGMYFAIYFSEYCYGCYLNAEVMECVPSLQTAIDLCNDIWGLSNDLFSYPREVYSELNLVNSFLVLGKAMTLEEAVQASIDYVNQCHDRYDQAIEGVHREVVALSPVQRASVLKFVDGLHTMLAASYHWQTITKRYRHQNHILEDLRLPADQELSASSAI